MLESVPLSGPASFAFREFNLATFTYPWHRHPEAELTWILEGEGLRYAGDSVEPFQAGDFCLIGPHLPHAWLSTKPGASRRARSLVVQFDPAIFGPRLLELPELARVSRLLRRAARGVCFGRDLGGQMREKITARRAGLPRLTALLEILDELAGATGARPLSLAAWTQDRPPDSDPRLGRVLRHLNDHAHESVAQAQVAKLLHMSPPAFSRFFRRTMGRTFQAYLTDMRLSLACRQLLETERTVSEIAYASGFGNLSNFNRSFRLRRGLAPRDFRRRSMG